MADEKKIDRPRHVVMDGPPWGGYVDPDLAYIRGQLGAVGSGALGGQSFAKLGGFVEADAGETHEAIDEARRILERRAEEEEEEETKR